MSNLLLRLPQRSPTIIPHCSAFTLTGTPENGDRARGRGNGAPSSAATQDTESDERHIHRYITLPLRLAAPSPLKTELSLWFLCSPNQLSVKLHPVGTSYGLYLDGVDYILKLYGGPGVCAADAFEGLNGGGGQLASGGLRASISEAVEYSTLPSQKPFKFYFGSSARHVARKTAPALKTNFKFGEERVLTFVLASVPGFLSYVIDSAFSRSTYGDAQAQHFVSASRPLSYRTASSPQAR
ncbi:hypothetical protein DFH11DRAFT_1727489 [Phellopilus nigrolimitatus]|nr:hypothetical protein DFH11DRAFT_1727489 [Phellopilus nigrolimitatus]